MLFEIGFQYLLGRPQEPPVVIWCSLKLVFSGETERYTQAELWFDALWNWFSVGRWRRKSGDCCDLMLFEIGFQYRAKFMILQLSCDLMLFEIGFQLTEHRENQEPVVIWCSLKLVFSDVGITIAFIVLWFDALWNWFSVRAPHAARAHLVVIWCSLKLVFSVSAGVTAPSTLWFDALWNWFSVE